MANMFRVILSVCIADTAISWLMLGSSRPALGHRAVKPPITARGCSCSGEVRFQLVAEDYHFIDFSDDVVFARGVCIR